MFFFLAFSMAFIQGARAQNPPPELAMRLVMVKTMAEKGLEETSLTRELNLNSAYFSLRQQPGKTGPVSYQILLHQIPVEGASAWILEGFEKTILCLPDIDFQQPPIMASTEEKPMKNPVWLQINGEWEAFEKIEKHETWPRLFSATEYYDSNGQLRFRQDGLYRFSPSPDSLVRAAVFRPDPVTRLQMPYGGQLKDRGDSNSVSLTMALDTVFFRIAFENDSFELKNGRFRMGEFSPPFTPKVKGVDNSFLYTRDNPLFEEVNVFYHLNSFRKFIDSLGFTSLANYPLKVDAHGMDGMDQSAYSPVMDVLAYGDGNVDDGEDAAVVVHEYGHALCHSGLPFGNSGQERKTAEEGICDYLAGSYVKNVSTWQWQKLFKWDGWNEFWPGREALTSKRYPENMLGQIHRDGEIFSSALMHLEMEIGRAATHQILLRSFSLLVPTLSMRQVAFMILQSDSILFAGAHTPQIITAFDDRGLSPYNIIVSHQPQRHGEIGLQIRCVPLAQGGHEIRWQSHEEAHFQLFDASGRLLMQAPRVRNKMVLAALNPGFYLVELQTQSGIFRQPCLVGW